MLAGKTLALLGHALKDPLLHLLIREQVVMTRTLPVVLHFARIVALLVIDPAGRVGLGFGESLVNLVVQIRICGTQQVGPGVDVVPVACIGPQESIPAVGTEDVSEPPKLLRIGAAQEVVKFFGAELTQAFIKLAGSGTVLASDALPHVGICGRSEPFQELSAFLVAEPVAPVTFPSPSGTGRTAGGVLLIGMPSEFSDELVEQSGQREGLRWCVS